MLGISVYLLARPTKLPNGLGDDATTTATNDSLGSQIYSEVTAEGQTAVPSPTPVPNPVAGLYKNPFE